MLSRFPLLLFLGCLIPLKAFALPSATAGFSLNISDPGWTTAPAGGISSTQIGNYTMVQELQTRPANISPPGGIEGKIHQYTYITVNGQILSDSIGPWTLLNVYSPGANQETPFGGSFDINHPGLGQVLLTVTGSNAKQGGFFGGTSFANGNAVKNYTGHNSSTYGWFLNVTDAGGTTSYGLNFASLTAGSNYNYKLWIPINGNARFDLFDIAPNWATGTSVLNDGNPSMSICALDVIPEPGAAILFISAGFILIGALRNRSHLHSKIRA